MLLLAMQMEAARVMNQIDEADRLRIHTITVEETCVRVVCPRNNYRAEYMLPTVFRADTRASADMFECAIWLHVVQTSLAACARAKLITRAQIVTMAHIAEEEDMLCDEDDEAIMYELFGRPDPSTTVAHDDELMIGLHSPVASAPPPSLVPSPFKDPHRDDVYLTPVSPISASDFCPGDDPPLLELNPAGVTFHRRLGPLFPPLAQSVPFPS